jgi:hypothetical protein
MKYDLRSDGSKAEARIYTDKSLLDGDGCFVVGEAREHERRRPAEFPGHRGRWLRMPP